MLNSVFRYVSAVLPDAFSFHQCHKSLLATHCPKLDDV